MPDLADTIVAVATPPGRGGIGVVRMSGPKSAAIARALLGRDADLEPRHATFARLAAGGDEAWRIADQVVATWFPAPHSYTGEDVVELSAHGSPVVLTAIVREACRQGARLAGPGEFTLRAFVNGRMDLVQAEAVGDLIAAVTPAQARLAFDQLDGTVTRGIRAIETRLFELSARVEASLDFPEEGYHFIEPGSLANELSAIAAEARALLRGAGRARVLREGRRVSIAGRTNSGKSSIFNSLLGHERAIVNPAAGTTRDVVSEPCDIEGIPVTLVDTAGLREADDPVEREGISRAQQAHATSDLVVFVLDRSRRPERGELEALAAIEAERRLVVVNKRDLAAAWDPDAIDLPSDRLLVSALTGEGLDDLRQAIGCRLAGTAAGEAPALSNVRHIGLLERSAAALERAAAAAADGMPEEFVLADVQEGRQALEELTGRRTSDELLAEIFSRFCIGK